VGVEVGLCGGGGGGGGGAIRFLCHCLCFWERESSVYLIHHTQQISTAAVVNDSKAILKCIISRKQKACSCTSSTTGAAYAASGAWRA